MDSDSLSRLIDLEIEPRRVWQTDELGDVLRTQLCTPLLADLAGEHLSSGEPVSDHPAGSDREQLTFRELFHGSAPPLPLLRAVKDFAKSSRHAPESPLPVEVCTVLYCASILIARARCGVRISSIDDSALAENVEWVLAQDWVDAETKQLIANAWDRVRPRGGG